MVYISFMSPIKNTHVAVYPSIVGSSSQQHGKEPYPWQPHPWHSWQRAEPCKWNRETPLRYPYSLSFITYLHLYLSYLIHISSIYHRSFMTYLVSGAPNKFVAKVSLGAAMASAPPVGPDVLLGCSVWAKAVSSAVRAKYDESMTWILYG